MEKDLEGSSWGHYFKPTFQKMKVGLSKHQPICVFPNNNF
jgi:hypothetical protein